MERIDVAPLVSLEQVLEADARARVIAGELVAVAA